MPTVISSDRDATLEICRRCYTGCPYCYLQGNCHTRGEIVPFSTLVARIDWIKEHTNCDSIWLVGGEPLLHPHFINICEYVLALGLRLYIVTSGKISLWPHEQKNLKYLLELYESGKVDVSLSYHGSRNHKAYTQLFKDIKARFEKHREALKQLNRYQDSDYDLVSTAVIDSGHPFTKSELVGYVNGICRIVDWTLLNSDQETHVYDEYQKHLQATDESRLSYNIWSVDEFRGFRVKVSLIGATTITHLQDSVRIVRPGGGTCPVIESAALDNKIVVPTFLIRTDGGLVFPRAECIDTSFPFLNVDVHKTPQDIFKYFEKSLDTAHKMIYAFNRKKAVESCDENGEEKECTSCPFMSMCGACWKLPKY